MRSVFFLWAAIVAFPSGGAAQSVDESESITPRAGQEADQSIDSVSGPADVAAPAPVAPAPVAESAPAPTPDSVEPPSTESSLTEPSSEPPLSEPRAHHPMAPRVRLVGLYSLGFGGSIAYDWQPEFGPGQKLTHDMDRAQSLTFRFEVPAGAYLTLGGALWGGTLNSQRASATGESPISRFDLGVVVRGRYTFDLGVVGLEPSLAIPAGFSVAVFDKDFSGQPGFGWHIGLLFGGQVFFGGRFGLLFELGWIRHQFSVDARNAPATVVIRQGVLQLGLLVGLGA